MTDLPVSTDPPKRQCQYFKPKPKKVSSKICIFYGCNKISVCGLPGTKIVEYCNKHKPDDYVYITDKLCVFDGCKKKQQFIVHKIIN